jgi:hypothetical protein
MTSTTDGGVVTNRAPRDGHMALVRSPDGISIELLQGWGLYAEYMIQPYETGLVAGGIDGGFVSK